MARGSASKVYRWRRCKHRVWYSDMLEIERKIESIAPSKGILIHNALATHYSGGDWTKPIKELKPDLENVFDEERQDWINLASDTYKILRGYFNAYRGIDKDIKTLATEVEFEIPIGENHTYSGYIDWIFEDSRGVWVADHKTASTLPKDLDLYNDLQTFMYYEAVRTDEKLKEIIKGKELQGIVFNHIKSSPPKEPKILKSGEVSRAKCNTDVATYFDVVKKQGLNPEDYKEMIDKLKDNVFYRRTKVPISEITLSIIKDEIEATLDDVDRYTAFYEKYGEQGKRKFTRTMMKQRCNWDCQYRDLCYAELSGMNIDGMIDADYRPKQRREEDEEDE